jgi:Polyketide cyclase / dehydrase and lipid transport
MGAANRSGEPHNLKEVAAMDGNVVSVERVIAAPAAELFAIVADTSRHPEIDGSGTVVKPKAGAPAKLKLGSTFGMSMKAGVPYSMSNTVIEFEEDRRIAWKTVLSGFLGRFIGGRIWRYEFEPVEGGTLVRESWDISQDKQGKFMKRGKLPSATAESMTKSLAQLATVAESPAAK